VVAFLGSTTIGGPLVGWIGESAGPRWALAIGGFAALGAGIYALLAMRSYRWHKAPAEAFVENPITTEEDSQVL
jgi:hypothetical protein